MTTLTATTEYTVTLGYCATEWLDPEGNPSSNYDYQPLATRTVVVELPSNSTPFDIYCKADESINDDDVAFELSELGGTGLDGDGTTIAFDGKEYRNSYDSISPNTSWSEFN